MASLKPSDILPREKDSKLIAVHHFNSAPSLLDPYYKYYGFSHPPSAKKQMTVSQELYLEKAPTGDGYKTKVRLHRLYHFASSMRAPIMFSHDRDTYDVHLYCEPYDQATNKDPAVVDAPELRNNLDIVLNERPRRFRCDNVLFWFDQLKPKHNVNMYVGGMLGLYQDVLQVHLERMGVDFRITAPCYDDVRDGKRTEIVVTVATNPPLTREQQKEFLSYAEPETRAALRQDTPSVFNWTRITEPVKYQFETCKSSRATYLKRTTITNCR